MTIAWPRYDPQCSTALDQVRANTHVRSRYVPTLSPAIAGSAYLHSHALY